MSMSVPVIAMALRSSGIDLLSLDDPEVASTPVQSDVEGVALVIDFQPYVDEIMHSLRESLGVPVAEPAPPLRGRGRRRR